jgi:excinuclease UvrABC ATPase subunit
VCGFTTTRWSFAEVLDLPFQEVLDFLENIPSIQCSIRFVVDVGWSYLHLGQSSPTLSGGEIQRNGFAKEFSKPAQVNTPGTSSTSTPPNSTAQTSNGCSEFSRRW